MMRQYLKSLTLLIITSSCTIVAFYDLLDIKYNVNDTWEFIENVPSSPFDTCEFRSDIVNIPQFYYSKSRNKYIYGGFTADLGWMLLVTRYSILNNIPVQFPSNWGHGGDSPLSIFKEITPDRCLNAKHNRVFMEGKHNQTLRHILKLYPIYDSDGRRAYPAHLHNDNDLQTMRHVFKWLFRLNSHARKIVDEHKRKIGKVKYAIHIRRGDKIGMGGGPKESQAIPISAYKEVLDYHRAKTIFVASDDYSAISDMTSKGYRVRTLTPQTNTGFAINNYQGSVDDTLLLWAEMEIMAEADYFIGNMESNVGRTVHLMRWGKNPDTTIDAMGVYRNVKSCCQLKKWKHNCFWLCS